MAGAIPAKLTNGEPSAAQRKMFAKMGIAMPDGSYYVRNGPDLDNAIRAVGRGVAAGDSGNAIRKHIMRRASMLKLTSKIPDTWNSDGSLKHMSAEEFVEHFGVKGMHWGVRRSVDGNGRNSSAAKAASDKTASPDARNASDLQARVNANGTKNLSNKELQDLVTRMNLDKQYGTLSSTPAGKSKVSKGRDFVDNQSKTGRTLITAAKTAQEFVKVFGPIIVAAAAGAAAAKAGSGSSGPVRMPRLAIAS